MQKVREIAFRTYTNGAEMSFFFVLQIIRKENTSAWREKVGFKGSRLTQEQQEFNKSMSAVRVTVEWRLHPTFLEFYHKQMQMDSLQQFLLLVESPTHHQNEKKILFFGCESIELSDTDP